ncbi:hypothetical protein EPN42_13910 [bacterium]|nr:MAG: hypothetical protein EPN42_13910 [bacterium]
MRRLLVILGATAVFAAGCTPNAASVAASGGAALAPGAAVQRVDVNLGGNPPLISTLGTLAGYAPNPSTVAVGTVIVFHNSESFPHTASAIAGATFPAASPFTIAALQPSGARLSDAGWSSGQLQPGAASQPLTADTPGIYLYGCFFHYGTPMRGAIVVQ